MNPQAGQQSGQNPYMAFLQSLQSKGGQSAPGQGMGPGQAPQQPASPTPGGAPAGLPGAGQPQMEDAAMPGQNPGVSKNLMGAMNQLHGAITIMTDPQEIRMVRSIIVLLNQLIQKDQEVQNQKTGTFQGQNPGESNLRPGAGQPAGMPSPSSM